MRRLTLPALVLILCPLATRAPADDNSPATAPVAVTAEQQPLPPYRTSAEQFAASEPARRHIDPAKVDDALLAAAVFHETNRRRARHDLPALSHSPTAAAAALMHARDMAAGGFFAHENPTDPARREPIDRARLAGLRPRYVAENLATHTLLDYEAGRTAYVVTRDGRRGVSYTTDGPSLPYHTYASFAAALLEQWMNSPGHRANILAREPQALGTAHHPFPHDPTPFRKVYCVQVFVTPGQ